MLENMKGALDRGISAVSIKSEAMAETSKVRAQLQNLERERDSLITKLGASMYQMWQTNRFSREAFEEMCKSIRASEEGIEACNRRLEEIRQEQERQMEAIRLQQAQQAQPAPAQGEPVEAGQFWDNPPQPAAPAGKVCPCGNVNPAEARFCTKCGQPLT